MSACSNCGRQLPEGALFCPDCGASATGYSIGQTDISPSHFNSGMTATTDTPLAAGAAPPPEQSGFAVPASSPPSPEERKRSSSSTRRRGLVLVAIAVLAVLLVGTSFEAGLLGTGAGGGSAVNSPSTPLTGGQLYAAYASDPSQAEASYTNKNVYIQDSLDFGVSRDSNGQYFSSVNSETVILFWSGSAQLGQLSQGTTVLAECSVEGVQSSPGAGYLLYLQDCGLISIQSQPSTSTSSTGSTTIGVPVASD